MTKEKILFTFALIAIMIYLLPYYVFGENTAIRIHDNLDSNVVWYKLMADTGTLFSGIHTKIPNIMNGLPRNSLGSELDIGLLIYALFPPFTAYTINQTVMRFVAFFGMYLLLDRHIIGDRDRYWITIGTSLAYAFLPFWPSGELSIAGLPLALYVFLRFKERKQTKWDWLMLCLLPFYSSFILSFFFFLICMGLWWLISWIREKNVNGAWFLAMTVMTGLYLIVNYRIIFEMFIQSNFTPHRNEFDRGVLSIKEALLRALGYFVFGQTHVIRLTEFIVLPVMLFVLFFSIFKRIKATPLWILFVLNAVFSLIIAFYYSSALWQIKDRFPLIRSFNFGRIHFLEPLLWYIGFALALNFIWRHFQRGKWVSSALLLAQVLLLFSYQEPLKYGSLDYPTFKAFYSPKLFRDIQTYIGRPPASYRVVSIGLHPAIAQYNGFYTLDGYVVSYSLRYKHQFRRIIAPELIKSPRTASYFDKWGSRCYLFTAELGRRYNYTKDKKKDIHHLQINSGALKEMGGRYIFSAVKILNAKANHLIFLHKFERSDSPWAIYLYEVE
ncbi:DUF6044 family protein [Camelliibacillus cellulosilyticus]|uniref:DUF6044 family protein n=1 Tax=Camelliibacillus cellulosilyticus TaxID=2174486 RepID=A0ABV9GNH8_9BACL